MISLNSIAYIDDAKGRIWDISAWFHNSDSMVTIRHKSANTRSPEPVIPPTKEEYEYRSRSYSGKYVVEVFSTTRCGIDMEAVKPAEANWSIQSPLFERAMLAPGEKELILATEYSKHSNLSTLIWASKEALAKALGDATNYEPTQLISPLAWYAKPHDAWAAEHQEFVTENGQRLIIWLVTEKVPAQH
mgnify:FL=1